jgi:radical SAM superfamily enzyme YgiQ (UPF0313 family)
VTFERILLTKPPGRRGLSYAFDLIPIGLEYVAAQIEYDVEDINIVDMEMEQRSFRHLVYLYHPDLVGITISAKDHNTGLHLAKIAKKNGITTVVGGYHPTGAPDLLLSYPQVDMIIRGEGELTMKELVKAGSPEGVLGVSYRKGERIIHNKNRPQIRNLDSLLFPARHLRQYNYKSTYQSATYDVLVTSRGCYGQCSFCCEPNMNHGQVRCRSPENVIEEILEMIRYHEGKSLKIFITDPNFMGHPERVSRLCDLLQMHDLRAEFAALVRPDDVARNPEIMRKMCNVGITWFDMGIESANLEDLRSIRKGVTTAVHKKAVQAIRENGGNAGGTFLIGLPDQTEEDVKRIPIYAREIGLTSAAFGIATPYPGTEFYNELNSQGLIFETNWDRFDEMHSVYETKHLSKEKLEELATYCMATFWNIDTFIDQLKVFQKRTRKKIPLIEFIHERAFNVWFIKRNGIELHKENFHKHVKTFMQSYPSSRIEAFTRKEGIQNVVEMSRFLRILGPQTIQCTLNLTKDIPVSFVIKTIDRAVEYIEVIWGKQDDSTIDLDFDLNWMLNNPEKTKIIRKLIVISLLGGNIRRPWYTIRLISAVGIEILMWKLRGR